MTCAFITVTDRSFFAGTVATVNSVIHFHPDTPIYVVHNEKNPLTATQIDQLSAGATVRVLNSEAFNRRDRYINAWELKAHAAADLSADCDVIIGIDSDCVLCSGVDEEINHARAHGSFLGGRDGDGVDYSPDYEVYGMKTPARNSRYMSTSLYFCAATPTNRKILSRWSDCCNAAVFNGRGPYPGHGDQGVLNAVLFAGNRSQNVELLPNELWSQHWVFWDTSLRFEGGRFVNESMGNLPQRAFHCGGAEKFWSREHRDRLTRTEGRAWPYIWFLALYGFGACRPRTHSPEPSENAHLARDLSLFLPQIFNIYPEARVIWDEVRPVADAISLHGNE